MDEEDDIWPGVWDFGEGTMLKVIRVLVIDLANEKGDHARAHVPHTKSAGDPDT